MKAKKSKLHNQLNCLLLCRVSIITVAVATISQIWPKCLRHTGPLSWFQAHSVTGVYSWNTYPACLLVMSQIDSAYACILHECSWVVDCKYHMRFRKGEVAEITAKRTALTCVMYWIVPLWFCSLIFIEYSIFNCPSYPAWSVFQYFFADTHTHGHNGIALSRCACTRRVNVILCTTIAVGGSCE